MRQKNGGQKNREQQFISAQVETEVGLHRAAITMTARKYADHEIRSIEILFGPLRHCVSQEIFTQRRQAAKPQRIQAAKDHCCSVIHLPVVYFPVGCFPESRISPSVAGEARARDSAIFADSSLFLFGRQQLFSHSRRVGFADVVDVNRIANPVDRFEVIQKVREILG